MTENEIARIIVDAAFKIHTTGCSSKTPFARIW
jgi:hypothetical protein